MSQVGRVCRTVPGTVQVAGGGHCFQEQLELTGHIQDASTYYMCIVLFNPQIPL